MRRNIQEMIYTYLKARVKHAVRFRHKRGFGVHSPFMFNFILNVIRDRRHRFSYPEEAERRGGIGHRERSLCRLLYRLAAFLEAREAACFTQRGEVAGLYLRALECMERIGCNSTESGERAEVVYIGRDCRTLWQGRERELLEALGKGRQCVVVADIYKSRFNASLWRSLSGRARVRVDMMWYGILLFDEKLQPGSYHLTL